MSKFEHESRGNRPLTKWNNTELPLTRVLTPIHFHEFGWGYDIQYKDANGNVQAKMDGLTISEAKYLKDKSGW